MGGRLEAGSALGRSQQTRMFTGRPEDLSGMPRCLPRSVHLGGPQRVSNRKFEISSVFAPPRNDVEHLLFTDAHSSGLGTSAPPPPPHLPRFAAWANGPSPLLRASSRLPTPPSVPAHSSCQCRAPAFPVRASRHARLLASARLPFQCAQDVTHGCLPVRACLSSARQPSHSQRQAARSRAAFESC